MKEKLQDAVRLRPLLGDGAMGTQLMLAGLTTGRLALGFWSLLTLTGKRFEIVQLSFPCTIPAERTSQCIYPLFVP